MREVSERDSAVLPVERAVEIVSPGEVCTD